MSYIYAMSDIHGYADAFEESLRFVDLDSDAENKLVLLGDYVNKGPYSMDVLYKIYHLQRRYPKQVIVLRGNHDERFLRWLMYKNKYDTFFRKLPKRTIRSFFPDMKNGKIDKDDFDGENSSLEKARQMILNDHLPLIQWLQKLPFYYETENQIFVHAGILEDAGEWWKDETPDEYLLEKLPPETGTFYKDIIAGHVSSAVVAADWTYLGKVYWDGKSHYYIDGNTRKSKVIPVLKFNKNSGAYTSFEQVAKGRWVEYLVNGK